MSEPKCVCFPRFTLEPPCAEFVEGHPTVEDACNRIISDFAGYRCGHRSDCHSTADVQEAGSD